MCYLRIQVSSRAISTPHTVSAQKFHRAYFQRPKLQKGGYLYTPQIKFGRILNNSRFGRLCTVFLHSRHSAFLQIAPISRPAASARCLFSANGPDWPATAPPAIKNSPTRLCRFLPGQQIAPVFCALYFSGTNQPSCKIAPIFTFFICLQKTALFACAAILRVFLAFYFRARLFKKQHLFCVCQKSGSILTAQKEGGFFILSHQNSTLN